MRKFPWGWTLLYYINKYFAQFPLLSFSSTPYSWYETRLNASLTHTHTISLSLSLSLSYSFSSTLFLCVYPLSRFFSVFLSLCLSASLSLSLSLWFWVEIVELSVAKYTRKNSWARKKRALVGTYTPINEKKECTVKNVNVRLWKFLLRCFNLIYN